MWCIRAYEYVVAEAKMTKIFAVSLQASVVSQVSRPEYAFECCREQLWRYGISMSYSSPDVVSLTIDEGVITIF